MNPNFPSSPNIGEASTRDGPTQPETTACSAPVRAVPTPPQGNLPEVAATGSTFGRYVLIGEIARGGMGVVYKARQEGLERLVALKMILGAGVDHDMTQRFLLEAQSAAALDHPNVVPIYDSGEINGRLYFTMALIDGPNLREYATDRGPLPIKEAVRLFAQIVAGVAHAHQSGIIHRDLKPANVLIDRDGRPRVTDFGLAKRPTGNVNLTTTGQVIGTPAYMAPEQARESKYVGPPADVYSLGAILYFLLTGRPPIEGDGATDLLIKVVTEQPVVPSVHNANVPPAIEELCMRCLSKSPADRSADATALAAAFADAAASYLPQSSGIRSPQGDSFPGTRTHVDPVYATTVPPRSPPAPVAPPLEATILPATPPTTPTIGVASSSSGSSRRPLIAWLSVAVLAFVGVSILLTIRGCQEPTAFPSPTRKDFTLTIQLTGDGVKMDRGLYVVTLGTTMEVHLWADRDCHVRVWSIDPAGPITQLFPNKNETNDELKARETRVIPGKKGGKFRASSLTGGAESERLRVIAFTSPPPLWAPGVEDGGPFTCFPDAAAREGLAGDVRGITQEPEPGENEPNGKAVAEYELLYRVRK